MTQTLFLTAASLCLAACADEIVTDDDTAATADAVRAKPKNVTVTPIDDALNWQLSRPVTLVIKTEAQYEEHFGHVPPAHIRFGKEWVVFYYPGYQATSGHEAKVTVKQKGTYLDIVTTLESPGADCEIVAEPEMVYVLAKFRVPEGADETVHDVPVLRDCTTEPTLPPPPPTDPVPPATAPSPDCPTRQGGAMVTIETGFSADERFTTWVTTPAFIDQAKRLLASGESLVPLFKVLPNTDCDGRWNFQLAPEASWAEVTTEVCDGIPSQIHDHINGWIGVSWCPWGTRVISVDDRRPIRR